MVIAAHSTQEITQEEILYSSIVDEPIRTIMLLRKSDKSKIRARGQQLLKKAAARCMHVQTGPKREDCRRAYVFFIIKLIFKIVKDEILFLLFLLSAFITF